MKIDFTSPEHCQRLGASREGSRLVRLVVACRADHSVRFEFSHLTSNQVGDLKNKGAAGDTLGRFIDADDAITGYHQVRPLRGRLP